MVVSNSINYNAKDYLLACLASLAHEALGAVIVADNGSSDGSEAAVLAHYPDVRSTTGADLGYAARPTWGQPWSSPYLLISNPDVVVGEGAWRPCTGSSMSALRSLWWARAS